MKEGTPHIGTGRVQDRRHGEDIVPLPDRALHEMTISDDRHREYDLLVEAGILIPAEELLRMSFPQSRFVDDDAEYFRWYEYGGLRRPRPLDFDELACYLMVHRGYTSMEEAHEDVRRYSGARRGDQALWKRITTRRLSMCSMSLMTM